VGNLRILGIDPGVTTGWALLDFEPGTGNFEIIQFGETHNVKEIEALIPTLDFDLCAIESFYLIPRLAKVVAANDPEGLTQQVIGAMKILVPDDKLFFQRPRKKELCPDRRLIDLGLMRRESKHIKDAMRHCVVRGDIFEFKRSKEDVA
jgi:hypothetical protein